MRKRSIPVNLILAGALAFCLHAQEAESAQNGAFSITVTVPISTFSEIVTPADAKICSQMPVITGTTSQPNKTVMIKGTSGSAVVTVATATSDANGKFAVEVSSATPLDAGANTLTPYVDSVAGTGVTPVVTANPTPGEQPQITSPGEGQRLKAKRPTVSGKGLAGQTVALYCKDASGVVSVMGQGTVNATGDFSVIPSSDFTSGENSLYVVIAGVASPFIDVTFVDPYGIVYDSETNQPIEGAVITIQRSTDGGATWFNAVPGVDIAATDSNPQTTAADGAYSYLTVNGDFRFRMSKNGYVFPSTVIPAGQPAVGSHGELFTVAGAVLNIDIPLDFSGSGLLGVEKDANKKEVVVGDIVTYTITIKNTGSSDVTNVYLKDKLAAGLKYLDGKVLLDGTPVADPPQGRSRTFNIGTVSAGGTRTLRYQVVVGSGVSFGKYENSANAEFLNGRQISNTSTETVKVIPDVLFDMGTVIGKAFWDLNENGVQDNGEEPVGGVQIMTENGAIITADKYGRFHLQAILPGRHMFRLLENTLPDGAYLTTGKAIVADVTPGLLLKVNFGINAKDGRQKMEETGRVPAADIVQEKTKPLPRLNAGLFGGEVLLKNGKPVGRAEFMIFTNYSLFIDKWRLEILEKDSKTLVRRFEGNAFDLARPIYWDGKDALGRPVREGRSYVYVATVTDKKGKEDSTRENSFAVREDVPGKKEKDPAELEKSKKEWLISQYAGDNTDKQNIIVAGETIRVKDAAGRGGRIRISKAGSLQQDVPVYADTGINAQDLLSANPEFAPSETGDTGVMDIILPNGEYDIEVTSAALRPNDIEGRAGLNLPYLSETDIAIVKKHVKIGEDYLCFVAMGDGKAGYTFNRGNIEPAGSDDTLQKGFWANGKLAYNLKGKILGKYLITSSLDTSRQQEELFRNLDPDKYYPVYGDDSNVNWSATNTQGMLYLLIEWDKSSIIWGNYNTSLTDTEFAQFNRSLYGGKVYYESVSQTKFGDPKTKLLVFKAMARQKSAHVEFLGTGGSLYYLPHKNVIEGSEKVKIEVRDKITGLVLSTLEQKENADYYIKYDEGRIIFWAPIAYKAAADSIISSSLLNGNPVYVIVDYEHDVKDKYNEGSFGGRYQQAFTDNIILGGTYVNEELDKNNYELAGADANLYLSKDIKITGEYARSKSEETGSFVSTDGGLAFTELPTDDNAEGTAYGIKGEAKLFNNLGMTGYYKMISRNFSTAATTAQQGKELLGFRAVYNFKNSTRFIASYDLQKLLDDGNLQAQAQVGAQETQTTMAQLTHTMGRLTLTGEYRHGEVEGVKDAFVSETNSQEDAVAVKADYKLAGNTVVSLGQQAILSGPADYQTTIGLVTPVWDWLSLRAKEVVGTKGAATSVGALLNVKERFTLTGDITRANLAGGIVQDAVTVSASAKPDDFTELNVTRSIGESADGGKVTSTVFGGSKKAGDGLTMKVDRIYAEDAKDGRETALTHADTVGFTKEGDGGKTEGSITSKRSMNRSEVSNTNIFGLSGDFGDKIGASVSFEKGSVQNLDGTRAERKSGAAAFAYVDRDAVTGDVFLKASGKLELRFDDGDTDIRQFVAYSAAEKRVNRDVTLFAKANISETRNTTLGSTTALYKELVFGSAYRPVYLDRFNGMAKYTYLEDNSPSGQIDYMDIEKTRAHVLSAEGIYDLTREWQLSEKLALRVAEEKVAGFDFTETRTWLWVNRVNYNFGKDFQIAAEYRVLGQEQAKDFKQGCLFEIAKKIGDFIQVGVGYNLTDFNDDLTHLDYTAHGPFVRITGTLYDRTPEERARAKEKYLEERIDAWGWDRVNKELSKPGSEIMDELHIHYYLAKKYHEAGELEKSREAYSFIINTVRMMHDEAEAYIRNRIELEERLKEYDNLARTYYKEGRREEARGMWEKILAEAKGR